MPPWITALIAVGGALLGFAVGYGALRAVVSDLSQRFASLTVTMNTAALTLQTVTADAKHFGQQLNDQNETLRDLSERLRKVEIELARFQTH